MDNKVDVIEPNLEQAKSIFVQGLDNKSNNIIAWLETNKSRGLLTELEFQFAAFIVRQEQTGLSGTVEEPGLLNLNLITVLSVFVIRQFNSQSTCFEVGNCALDGFDKQVQISLPPKSEWNDSIKRAISTQEHGPLTYYKGWLFLTRNFINEVSLADYLSAQSQIKPALSWNAVGHNYGEHDDRKHDDILSVLFPPLNKPPQSDSTINNLSGSDQGPDYDWQKQAVLNSLNHRFSVITGGPGTGKTTTVIKLLAATIYLYEQQAEFIKQRFGRLKIALAAPTGKAALRLTESISGNVKSLQGVDSKITHQIPTEATTLHRLLKPRGAGFLYNKNNQLPLNVLILDEASMVDLSMMSKLVEALSPQTQLVLLGDEQQLASVEAGNILAELCRPLETMTNEQQQQVMPLTKLKYSYRFNSVGGIGLLARAVISGDVNGVIQILRNNVEKDLSRRFDINNNAQSDIAIVPQRDLPIGDIVRALLPRYTSLCTAAKALTLDNEEEQVKRLFEQLHQFQILACVRQGETGVEGLNTQFTQLLMRNNTDSQDAHFAGRPILITENAYHLGLFNGDIGIQAIEPESGLLITYFIDANNQIKRLFNQRLPAHESVYAMTVHKSQGSEFGHGLLVLPPEDQAGALLSKELLYTAITRAKHQFTIYGNSTVIKKMVNTHTQRQSGLGMLLEERGGLL